MAYTKAPREDTYSQITIPACYDIDGTTGPFGGQVHQQVGMTNLLPCEFKPSPNVESVMQSVLRPSIDAVSIDTANTANLASRGGYVWQKTSSLVYYFVVVGTKVYTSTDGATWVLKHTLTTSATTPVGFTEFINSATNAKSLVMVDGVQGFVFTSDAAGTEIVDADFPTPHLPFPVYLDGYLFLAKTDTGDIYNSDLNSTTAWTAGSFISSELYPDDLKAIVKIDNYLLAIGTQGCEYFYDAANAIASPLRRVDGASLPFGTFYPYSIAKNKNTCILLANSSDGEMSLMQIKGMEHTDITPQWLITSLTANISISGISTDGLRGNFLRLNGDLLYLLNTRGSATTHGTQSDGGSYVYSTKHKMWSVWSIGDSATVSATTQYVFPVNVVINCSGGDPTNFVMGNFNTYPFFGTLFYNNGSGHKGKDVITDNGLSDNLGILWEVRTPVLTFGTLNQKSFSRFGIHAHGGNHRGYQVTVNTVDNDYISISSYTTTSTCYLRNSAVAEDRNPFPFVFELGRSRKRAFVVNNHGITGANAGITLVGFEININKELR